MKLHNFKIFEARNTDRKEYLQNLKDTLEDKAFAVELLNDEQALVHHRNNLFYIEIGYLDSNSMQPCIDLYDNSTGHRFSGRYIGRYTDIDTLVKVLRGLINVVFIQQIDRSWHEPTGKFFYHNLSAKSPMSAKKELDDFVQHIESEMGIKKPTFYYEMANIKVGDNYYTYSTEDNSFKATK